MLQDSGSDGGEDVEDEGEDSWNLEDDDMSHPRY
jgi:hypothetical protein